MVEKNISMKVTKKKPISKKITIKKITKKIKKLEIEDRTLQIDMTGFTIGENNVCIIPFAIEAIKPRLLYDQCGYSELDALLLDNLQNKADQKYQYIVTSICAEKGEIVKAFNEDEMDDQYIFDHYGEKLIVLPDFELLDDLKIRIVLMERNDKTIKWPSFINMYKFKYEKNVCELILESKLAKHLMDRKLKIYDLDNTFLGWITFEQIYQYVSDWLNMQMVD